MYNLLTNQKKTTKKSNHDSVNINLTNIKFIERAIDQVMTCLYLHVHEIKSIHTFIQINLQAQ